MAFFLSVGIEAGKAKAFGDKFTSKSFQESMISAFTSDFLIAQGMEMGEVYKILPEAAKRKAQAMQANAKAKHRSNNSQVVVAPEIKKKPSATLEPFKINQNREKDVAIYESKTVDNSPKIQMFPTIEELESQGAIELGNGNSQVALPGGISVTKASNDDNSRVMIQPIDSSSADIKERRREVVAADGSTAKEYTRISTSTTVSPIDSLVGSGATSAIALMQQQMQTQAMMQAQAQAQSQAQVQMQMRMQAQAQMQMQMRAQAAAAQAQAQYQQQQYQQQQQQQQQRMYQMQQQQQAAPSVHITIHTGDKGIMNQNPMTPPMPQMNQPMMQMNNPGMGFMGPMNPMAGAMTPLNPAMNPMTGAMMNPFDPTNPYTNSGFGF